MEADGTENRSDLSLDGLLGEADKFHLQYPDFSVGNARRVRVRGNVCYIVAGMLIRGDVSNPEVCLVEEAKESCRGQWYMPAGRLEPGESLNEGVMREVKEETGLDVDVQDLITVEVQGGGWYRFSFFCTVKGGKLKTSNEADKESLSANWFPVADIKNKTIRLRCKDCVKLIDQAVEYYGQNKVGKTRPPISVLDQPVRGMYFRLLIFRHRNSKTEIVISKDTAGLGGAREGLPIVEFDLICFAASAISKAYKAIVVDGHQAIGQPTKCLGVECLPKPSDSVSHGLCLTLLCPEKPRMHSKTTNTDRYEWIDLGAVNKGLAENLKRLEELGPNFHLL